MSKPILSPAIPQLPSGDLNETAKFFQEKLKFEVATLANDFGFLSVKREAVEIHFWRAETREQAKTYGSVSSCYIRVANVKALFEEFKSNGAEFRYELTSQPWGMLEMQIDDPFGNAIRFGEPVGS